MGFLLKLIGGAGGEWIAYASIAAVLLFIGGVGGNHLRGYVDAPIIARAQTAQAQAEADTQRARTALADQQKQIALDAQAASEKALASQTALQAQVSDLTVKLAMTDKARQAASTRFLDSLKAEPKNEQVGLSPPVRQYLAGVRFQQTGGANSTPAADRRPDAIPIPTRAAGVP